MNRILLFTLILNSFFFNALAQISHTDSSIFIPSLGANYAFHVVGGDMANTFGNHHAVGTDLTFKFKNQIILGLGFEYYFSDHVLNQDSYFQDIKNSKGYIIDGNGMYAEVFLYERGFNLQGFAGYQFHFWSPNPNSGPFIQVGFGFMQYHVRIENPGFTAPQIKDNYLKMYDRLTNGSSISQFIGYRFLGNKNLTNFYLGIEFTQAFTQNRRSYNADFTDQNLKQQLDLLAAFKVGWIIPFYNKAPKAYYYY
jgi:hypothetical protein